MLVVDDVEKSVRDDHAVPDAEAALDPHIAGIVETLFDKDERVGAAISRPATTVSSAKRKRTAASAPSTTWNSPGTISRCRLPLKMTRSHPSSPVRLTSVMS